MECEKIIREFHHKITEICDSFKRVDRYYRIYEDKISYFHELLNANDLYPDIIKKIWLDFKRDPLIKEKFRQYKEWQKMDEEDDAEIMFDKKYGSYDDSEAEYHD